MIFKIVQFTFSFYYMNNDLTFITNENGFTLKDRFTGLIKDSKYFDCLVGYFFSSGFYAIYKSLENTEKIRILIGISVDSSINNFVSKAKAQTEIIFSDKEIKDKYSDNLISEIETSEDKKEVELGIHKFIEWIVSGKLDLRVYPTQKIHAKVYIMTFKDGDRDLGRVITGSSNFTAAGFADNLEFNVELKDRNDYEFAKDKFEELWKEGVEVSKEYIETINKKTWLNQDITPYMLYVKFLYEYFKEDLSLNQEIFKNYTPKGYKELEYQKQAILNARKILLEYGGVFIADVVGLGKTYISTLLSGQLDGRTLVIAPPHLLDEDNPGSWKNSFADFRIHADFESLGKLEALAKRDLSRYENVIIDEAHRFRTETTRSFELLAQICRGKKIILVTATPYNNSPKDILSLIKLFQNSKKSIIPGLPNIEKFLNDLEKRLDGIDKQKDFQEYIEISKSNAKAIRERILKFIMVRRTRTEISKYFEKDLKAQKLKFPEVENPKALCYVFNSYEDKVFFDTIKDIAEKFKYSRYTPLLYAKTKISQAEQLGQRNMTAFMKILLIKRLESSFFAFRKSLERFIYSYEKFIKTFESGKVYISKKYSHKIFEALDAGNFDYINRLIEEGEAGEYSKNDFNDNFIIDLKSDLCLLKNIKSKWDKVDRDPKLIEFQNALENNPILKENKIIVFTESKETAKYLKDNIEGVLCFTGDSSDSEKTIVLENFDAKVKDQKNDYRVLITTDVLAEGVNLHRANVVINYDIPWNPTRLMQRVGRINRVDTPFDKIYTFNFFPTAQSNDEIKLEEIAKIKIHAFLALLGGDAPLLTEGEPIESHELFDKLMSKKSITGEDDEQDSELKYLNVIKDIRDKNPELFEKIKRLPKKSRSAKKYKEIINSLITYFRQGKIQKFFLNDGEISKELDFMEAARIFESKVEEPRIKIESTYFDLLEKNKSSFISSLNEDDEEVAQGGKGRESAAQVLKFIKSAQKNTNSYTETQEDFLKQVKIQLENGALPKQTTKETYKALSDLGSEALNPLKILSVLELKIPKQLLNVHYADSKTYSSNQKEVILSLFLNK